MTEQIFHFTHCPLFNQGVVALCGMKLAFLETAPGELCWHISLAKSRSNTTSQKKQAS